MEEHRELISKISPIMWTDSPLDISNQEVLQNIFGVYPDEYHEICFQVILCVIFLCISVLKL